MPERRFPPPWTVEELDACFVVRDRTGQQLAYVYFEDEPADARQPSCSARMRREGSRLTLLSYRRWPEPGHKAARQMTPTAHSAANAQTCSLCEASDGAAIL